MVRVISVQSIKQEAFLNCVDFNTN